MRTSSTHPTLVAMLLATSLLCVGSWPGRALAQPVPIVPMEDWVGADEVVVTDAAIELHLRVGHERPVIFPEPVGLLNRPPLPDTGVTIDGDVVLFASGGALQGETVVFVGDTTARRYRFEVSASAYGSRVPLRLRLP